MKMTLTLALAAATLVPAMVASAAAPEPASEVGRRYEIVTSYETSQQGSDGSSGSSSGRGAFVERVIGSSDAGLELEYDLPAAATAEERMNAWQFPARVLRVPDGGMQLLNGDELEARVDRWLDTAGATREACGQWIFTWNAFRIECDPQSVLATIRALDIQSADLREGALYHEDGALAPATIARTAAGPNGSTFTIVMEIDPDAVRRARAEADVALGQILEQPVTLDAALKARAKERVSGTIRVTFDTDGTGTAHRRTRVTSQETERPDGSSQSETATETVERRRLPPG